MSLMVTPGKVHTLIIRSLYSRKPDKIESSIIKVVPFLQMGCLLLISGSVKSLKEVKGFSFFDVENNYLCLYCKDLTFSIKTIS